MTNLSNSNGSCAKCGNYLCIGNCDTYEYSNSDTIEHFYWVLHGVLNDVRNKDFKNLNNFKEFIKKELTETIDALDDAIE